MVKLLDLRAKLIEYYKKVEFFLVPLIKFIFAFVVFSFLDGFLDQFDKGTTLTVISSLPVKLLLSVIVTFVPDIWFTMIVMLISTARITMVSIEAGFIVFVVLLIIYLMFLTMFRDKALMAIITGFCLSIHIPYVVPIIAALFIGPVAIVPVAVGVMVYYLSGSLGGLLAIKGEGMTDMPFVLLDMYKFFMGEIISNRAMLLTIFVFAVVIIATYYVSRLEFEQVHYIAIGFGGFIMLFGFIIGNLVLKSNISLLAVFFGTILAILLAVVAQFMRFSLDYKKIEKHQFEDDDYYYYVKAVPKIKMPEANVERKIIE